MGGVFRCASERLRSERHRAVHQEGPLLVGLVLLVITPSQVVAQAQRGWTPPAPVVVAEPAWSGKSLAAYLHLGPSAGRKSARTEEVSPSLLVDYAANGEPMGVEIITPDLVTARDVNAVLLKLGRPEMTPGQLHPLRAA